MAKKLTINEFKQAIKLDGNLKWIMSPGQITTYIIRAVDGERVNGRLTEDQADKLYDWAYDIADKMAAKNRK